MIDGSAASLYNMRMICQPATGGATKALAFCSTVESQLIRPNGGRITHEGLVEAY